MAKISTSQSINATVVPVETCTLKDSVHGSERVNGNYGSLAKSKPVSTFYIIHEVEPDDTFQRLSLKYGTNIQEIKRINKLWSDAELGLLNSVYIPILSSQVSTLRIKYPMLNITQSVPTLTNPQRKSSISSTTSDGATLPHSVSSSLTSTSITTDSSYQDYLSKIDKQIETTKRTLQLLNIGERSEPNGASASDMFDVELIQSREEIHDLIVNNEQRTKLYHQFNNNMNLRTKKINPREKFITTALQRIQREKEDFDEL